MHLHNAEYNVHEKYGKTCVKRPLSNRPQLSFQYQLSLNALHVKSIAECSKGSIPQYF